MTLRLAAIVLCTAAGTLAAQDQPTKHLLRYDFTQGASGVYRVTTRLEAHVVIGREQQTNMMEMTMDLAFEVIEVTEDGAKISHRLLRMGMEQRTPNGRVVFDTADESTVPPGYAKVFDVIGVPVIATVDRQGEVKVEEVSNSMAKLTGQTGFDGAILTQIAAVLPVQSVALDEEWLTTNSMAGPQGQLVMNVTSKLTEFDGRTAKIESKMAIDPASMAQMPVKPEFKESKSVAVIDLVEGVPRELSQSYLMAMRQDPQSVEVKQSMTLVRLPDSDGDK